MKLGVISDVHANLVAFEAVVDDMPPVKRLVCAGDVVGYNPWPAECVARVRDRAIPTVMGNHDRAVARGSAFRFNAMAQAGVDYARRTLDEDAVSWLRERPSTLTVADGRAKVVHGHPDDPDRYTYPDDFEFEMLGEESVLITGHTHVQGHRVFEDGIVMNPGSVGQPRDGDPRAAYAVVDLDEPNVEERRVEYDIEAVVDAVEAAELPKRIGTRLREGR